VESNRNYSAVAAGKPPALQRGLFFLSVSLSCALFGFFVWLAWIALSGH
jgi:hypothetical protein